MSINPVGDIPTSVVKAIIGVGVTNPTGKKNAPPSGALADEGQVVTTTNNFVNGDHHSHHSHHGQVASQIPLGDNIPRFISASTLSPSTV
jgi:hypothetical protein